MNYTKPCKEFTQSFLSLVNKSSNICITAHLAYDDDSIAATLSMYEFLHINYPNKKLRIIYTGEPSSRYKTFKNFERIEFVPDLVDVVDGVDLFIFLDGGQYNRFTYKPEDLKRMSAKTICIDHHGTAVENFDLCLAVKTYSSTSEIIYSCFYKKTKEKISKELAKIFLLGIFGDTSNLRYLRSFQADTLTVVKALIEAGDIDIQEFLYSYNTFSLRIFEIIRELIKNTRCKTIKNWPSLQLSFMDAEFKASKKYTDNEITQGYRIYMDNYLRSIEGYTWGFTIIPRDNGNFDISIRSIPGSVNARIVLESMKIGGDTTELLAGHS